MNISSLSLNPFSPSKHTEKYSELDTCGVEQIMKKEKWLNAFEMN
jgi:hypothetical protein